MNYEGRYSIPLTEKPWINDAPTMMLDPKNTLHLRPRRSLMTGMKGSENIAPSGYAAAMIPLREPWGLWKSGQLSSSVQEPVASQQQKAWLTIDPRWQYLHGVDHLWMEAWSNLNAHACWNEHEIQVSQVGFAVPRDFVRACQTGDDTLVDVVCCHIQWKKSLKLYVWNRRGRILNDILMSTMTSLSD